MSRFNEKDAAKLTGVSRKYAAAAWHNARNDATDTKFKGREEKKKYATYNRKQHGPHQRNRKR
jgi:hypothetical protein